MPPVKATFQPRQSVGRLQSLRPPQSGGIPLKRPQGAAALQPTRATSTSGISNNGKKPEGKRSAQSCPNPSCPAPDVIHDDDMNMKVCRTCGSVVSEDTLVSEVSFGENSAGAAIVQGSYVGADQTHTRSTGPGFHRGGGMESREITEQNGNRYIQQMALALDIPESAQKAAGQVFKLAVGLNFIQGRRTKTVAAVCLYIACRRQPGNTVMLIDLSDVLMINVFKVGRAYKLLLEELRLGGTVFTMNPVDPENLILRFARQLEFGNKTMHVAKEAARIVQRMNRDWMTTGRRPAGICGAALILAARMNNFRRTVREVVYVVKVTEVTINQRLNEFGSTDSGGLTVDEFRSVHLESAHDPPSFNKSKTNGSRRKKAIVVAPETAAAGNERNESVEQLTTTATAASKNRVDADGFAIPDIPIDPALTEVSYNTTTGGAVSSVEAQLLAQSAIEDADAEASKPKRGRKKQPLPEPTPEELASEQALENEMNQFLTQGSDMVEAATTAAEKPAAPTRLPVSDSAEIDASEFESDPEVANCLLSPAEVEIKERIWVHENRDYLRDQQAKALKRAFLESEDMHNNNVQRKPRKRRKGRLGDVTYLQGEDGKSSRASTPAEATRMMLEQRGYSKKINYKMLFDLYGDEGTAEIEKAEAERRSRSQSVASQGPSSTSNIRPINTVTTTTRGVAGTGTTGGLSAADYDDDDDDDEADEADEADEGDGGNEHDDDRDLEDAFAGNYEEEEDYYDYGD